MEPTKKPLKEVDPLKVIKHLKAVIDNHSSDITTPKSKTLSELKRVETIKIITGGMKACHDEFIRVYRTYLQSFIDALNSGECDKRRLSELSVDFRQKQSLIDHPYWPSIQETPTQVGTSLLEQIVNTKPDTNREQIQPRAETKKPKRPLMAYSRKSQMKRDSNVSEKVASTVVPTSAERKPVISNAEDTHNNSVGIIHNHEPSPRKRSAQCVIIDEPSVMDLTKSDKRSDIIVDVDEDFCTERTSTDHINQSNDLKADVKRLFLELMEKMRR